ncbi:serine/threonine protein kinase [Desulfonatronum thioautotrophicum]|uniref:serine/threonine protein kinase n=1 Tax=Desulfonatronum thioautotrophicum TaxID=617001 RepID=UPI000AF1500F|nr:serine/threonine protein kinase [Desulfonatronum thioautotrophicum]
MDKVIWEKVQRILPSLSLRDQGQVYVDTSEFMNISYGDVIALNGRHFVVIRDEAERRFGMEDPKFWVKRCRDLETEELYILKLVFHEHFDQHIGSMTIRCFRSPEKESRILELVKNDVRFMQGVTLNDTANNPVRILEMIRGRSLDSVIEDIDVDHASYFQEYFPGILKKYIGACEAVLFLHDHGERHGDIRRDHIWIEHSTGRYRWIDFDYAYESTENPFGLDLFGLGNILLFITGQGVHTTHDLAALSQGLDDNLTPEDFSLLFPNRLVNLRKRFPYIPISLNRVLLRFSAGTDVFYESVEELLDDLKPCLKELGAA